MTDTSSGAELASTEKEPLDVLGARTTAWWVGLLAGQMDQPHPVHGEDVRATVKDGVLTLKGTLPSQAELDRFLAEAEGFKGRGVTDVKSELAVAEAQDEPGVLVQTLIAVFGAPEEANFAAHYLEGHMPDQPSIVQIEPGQAVPELPHGFREQADSALREGKTLLLVTVDETAAFSARQMLEEDLRSLWMVAIPPQPSPIGDARRED